MIYRLNRVPEKNYIEFLNLLGITRDPAIPATTLLTFQTANNDPVIVPVSSQFSTLPTENEEGIIFETDRELKVLPINLTHVLLITKPATGKAKYKNITSNISGKPLSGITIKIPINEQNIITLGFDSANTEQLNLICRFSQAIKMELSEVKVSWVYSTDETSLPTSWSKNPNIIQDGTNGCRKNGVVSLKLDADWKSQNPKDWPSEDINPEEEIVDKKLNWLGLKFENSSTQALELKIEYILFNSVSATNALTVNQPEIYTSNGKPFQTFELKNAPLYKEPGKRNPYSHLEIQVRESLDGELKPAELWNQVEDFPPKDEPCYRVNPVSSNIYFGDFSKESQSGYGRIPPDGSEIQVRKYRYVAPIGSKGNVPSDTIKVSRTIIDGIASVTNLGSARGGRDEEDIEETKRRAPELLRNRYRAVTIEDYEYLAREASTKVKKVSCLPPRELVKGELLASGKKVGQSGAEAQEGEPWTYGSINRTLGQVNLIVIPDAPNAQNDPDVNSTPTLSEELWQEITEYLEARRPLTTKLQVHSPRYLQINVTVQIKIWSQAVKNGIISEENDFKIYKASIGKKISRFLHPLFGGLEGKGWKIGQGISASNLLNEIQPDPDIGFINDLRVEAGNELYEPKVRPYVKELGFWVQLADYEMICNGTHNIDVEKLNN